MIIIKINLLKERDCFNNKGIIFTFDTTLTTIILLVILFSFSIFLFDKIENDLFIEKQFFLEQKTISISDAIIKNNNPTNSMLGMSIIDFDKKRTLSNKISLHNTNFEQIDLDNFFIKEIKYTLKNGFEETIFFENRNSNSCFSVERFVIIENQKGLIIVSGCYE